MLSAFQYNYVVGHGSKTILQDTYKPNVLIIQIIKNYHHFNQEVCEYLMKQKKYQINYFVNVMVIQSNVLRMIFVYPNHDCTCLGY